MAALQQTTGVVSKVTATGFQMDGTTWYSISKFVDPQPAIPAVGSRVSVGVNSKGFACAIEPAGPRAVDAPSAAPVSREATITRLAVLKVAATFAASRPDMKSPDMIALAGRLEEWVTR